MSTKKTFSTLPQTKQHFEILDGLRGVAALAVVTFHFMELAIRALVLFYFHLLMALTVAAYLVMVIYDIPVRRYLS